MRKQQHNSDLPRHMVPCFLCKREFQFGPNRYPGRGVGVWDIRICDPCETMNHDGSRPTRQIVMNELIAFAEADPAYVIDRVRTLVADQGGF